MATRSMSGKSRDEVPAPKKVRTKKTQPTGAGADGPTAPAEAALTEAAAVPKAGKRGRFNAITIQAMQDAKAGKNLTRYRDEDDLFQKLGIKLGKAQTKAKA
jgi:hypothetical protein